MNDKGMRLARIGLLAAAFLSAGCIGATASPVTYDFSGTFYNNAGSVTGSFTYDATTQQVSSFSFTLPGSLAFAPTPSGSTMTSSNGSYVTYVTVDPSGETTFQISDDYLSNGIVYYTYLNLDFVSLAGSIGLDADLLQASSANPQWSTIDTFKSGSATAAVSATPLPSTFPLFVAGLAVIALLGWRRSRKAALAPAF